MAVDSEGRGRMLRALFNSGCSKSIILKKFTESKRRTKLKPRDHIRYTTYGDTFNSTAKASMGLQFIEFEEKGKQTVEHEFSVNGTHYKHEPSYDVIIGTDLMWNMGVKINFREETLEWDGETLPLKIDGAIQDKRVSSMLYSMHLDSPILKDTEERVEKILDSDYSKVDIDEMVDGLDISRDTKRDLKKTLHKFPTLFGGGLGTLVDEEAKIVLKKDAKPHASNFYHLPKVYEVPAKKEIERMVKMGIL